MKKGLWLFILIAVFGSKLLAQDASPSWKAGWANLDYAVPESPAFQILGVSPDNILKPSSVKAIALNIGNYFVTNGPIIPKSLSVEISPLLLNGQATLKQYNANKFLYRARFSVGTFTQNDGGYGVAEGFRFNIFDKTDLRANPALIAFFQKVLNDKAIAKRKAIQLFIKNNPGDPNMFEKLDTDPDLVRTINELSLQFMPEEERKEDVLSNFRDSIKNADWNKAIMDVGVAVLQTSTDSLISNLKFSQVGLWTSIGLPTGKKGQVLLGGRLSFVDSIDWKTIYSLGVRYFYGSNNIKGYFQAQFDHQNNQNNFTASLGCQFNITNGLWGQFTINLIVDENGKTSYQPGLNFGFGSPEKKVTKL